jgi:hypothetical protein
MTTDIPATTSDTLTLLMGEHILPISLPLVSALGFGPALSVSRLRFWLKYNQQNA